ncbi:MAG: TRAP transporter substrate-binding protein [Alphaproteobacteria bacterium]|nr:TRAP transporter substrate-binding protein [Alphaproteobacteria bacterium]
MTHSSIRSVLFRSSTLAAIGMAAAALAFAPAQAQQPITMKFATLTLNDIQHETLKRFKDELEKVTNGRIKVEVYPAGQLGGAPRQTEGLRLGTIEAAMGPPELFFGADRRYQVLAMAGLFKDNAHSRRVLNNPEFRKIFTDFSTTRGMIPIQYQIYDHQMFVFRQPVTSLAGFAGKRTRVLASETEQASVAALGAAPVPMSLPEVVPALQQGTIDGVSAVIGVFVPFRYNDSAPNAVDTGLWALTTTALVSKIWFDKLAPDLQKHIRDVAAKLEAPMYEWQVKRIQDDRKAWTDRGAKIVKLSAGEQADAEKRVRAAVQTTLDKNAPSKELYTKLKAIADKVN